MGQSHNFGQMCTVTFGPLRNNFEFLTLGGTLNNKLYNQSHVLVSVHKTYRCVPDLDRRHNDTAQIVQPSDDVVLDLRLPSVLKVKHGDGWTEEVGEVVQEDEAVPQPRDVDPLQVVVLHRDVGWQLPGTDCFVGGPGQAVR